MAFDPVTNTWSPAANCLDPVSCDEQTWTLLADGTVLTEECFGAVRQAIAAAVESGEGETLMAGNWREQAHPIGRPRPDSSWRSASKAEMIDMRPAGAGKTRLVFYCPSRSLIGYQGELQWDPTKPDGQPRRRVDPKRAEALLGWRAQVDFTDGLRQTIDWYLAHREQAERAPS